MSFFATRALDADSFYRQCKWQPEAAFPPEPIWGLGGRANSKRQDVHFWRLRGSQAGLREPRCFQRAFDGRAQRNPYGDFQANASNAFPANCIATGDPTQCKLTAIDPNIASVSKFQAYPDGHDAATFRGSQCGAVCVHAVDANHGRKFFHHPGRPYLFHKRPDFQHLPV